MEKKTQKQEQKYSLHSIDFEYSGVDCDYDISDCHEDCYPICRCKTITNVKITKIDLSQVLETICKLGIYNIDKYCVDRLLRIHKLYNPDSWNCNITPGYYGEEIQGIYLREDLANQLENEISNLLAIKTASKKIEYVLTLEYGYILDILKEREYSIQTVDLNDISFQKEHYKKLDRDTIDSYIEYNLPRCIVVKNDNGGYRLIDGYHRFKACKSMKINVLLAS